MPCARRAGHDQTHERMKKIMKKFLSSLLALTMILSLVIVPANAATGDTNAGDVLPGESAISEKDPDSTPELTYVSGLSISAKVGEDDVSSAGVKEGDKVKLTISGDPMVKSGDSEATKGVITAYSWSNSLGSNNTAEWTAGDKTTTLECTVTIAASNDEDAATVDKKLSLQVKVTSKNDLFAADIVSIEFGDNTYTVRKGEISVPKHNDNEFTTGTWTANLKEGSTFELAKNAVTFKNNQLTVKGINGETATITVKPIDVTVTLSEPTYSTISKDGTTQITATYNGPESSVAYAWYDGDTLIAGQTTRTLTWTPGSDTSAGEHRFTCTVTYGGSSDVVHSAAKAVTVENMTYSLHPTESITLYMAKGDTNSSLGTVKLYPASGSSQPVDDAAYTFSSSNLSKVSVSPEGVLTALSSGEATITITAKDKTPKSATQYKGKTYTKNIKVVVSALEYTLDAVESGSRAVDYRMSALKGYAEKVIADSLNLSASSVTVNTLTAKSPAVSTIGKFEVSSDYLTFTPPTKIIGKAQIVMTATTSSLDSFDITFIVPVTPIKTTYESQYPQPSGSSTSNFKYSVSVPDGYISYYVVAKNPSTVPTDYSEKLSGTKNSYTDLSPYTLSDTDFKDGKCELYLVTFDSDGTAYYGVVTVYKKSYDIEYNVVAGGTADFKQADFDDFFAAIAEDDGVYSPRRDSINLESVRFDSVSGGNSRQNTDWQLYDGSSKLTTRTDVKDLDDISISTGSKVSGTIRIGFTATGKVYTGSSNRGTTKSYSGAVVISVINEDIVYEVGVNSSVGFKASDFQSFLNTSSTSYKRSTLDYVTFDVGSNKAVTSYFSGTGALYRYYSAYGVNSTVDSKDEFYYNPKSSSKNYDLDDVTYVTSRFAKTGDIVYIPFTAYGTRNEKAEGTVAIKVKQTMNFTDVHTYDYFYDAVQWAVNKDITKGTSATTFSPKTGCTRAMIVTFLWRAADSPEPRSNSNKFTDVSATRHADYMKAILWATEQGITTGTGNNKFSPDATCTRAMIVTFLYRYKNSPAVYGSLNFTDVSKTTHSAYYNAILWAVNNKVTTGYGNGIFDPNGTCNRGDAVTFLYRALA